MSDSMIDDLVRRTGLSKETIERVLPAARDYHLRHPGTTMVTAIMQQLPRDSQEPASGRKQDGYFTK